MTTDNLAKKIIVLGASVYQVPLIKKAKEMGIYTIVCSIKGNYPGFEYADKVCYIDTTDADSVLELAREENIDGIITSGTDVCVPTAGKVCDELGLKGVSYKAAILSSNKIKMKQMFLENGVNTAKFSVVSSLEETLEAMKNLNLPVMIKAVDSSGSRGITKVRTSDRDVVEQAVSVAKSVSKMNEFIVEECIEGVEFGAQAMICDGKVKFVLPHGDYVFVGDTGVPVGHYAPYEIGEDVYKESVHQVEQSIKALGIDNCAVNVDLILRGKEVFVLEVGARAGATCLPEMVSIYYGIDYYKMMIQMAIGEYVDEIKATHYTPNVCKLLISDKTGVISKISFPDSNSENLMDLSCDYNVGDTVRAFKVGPDRIGQIVVKGENIEAAAKEMEQLIEKVEINVK